MFLCMYTGFISNFTHLRGSNLCSGLPQAEEYITFRIQRNCVIYWNIPFFYKILLCQTFQRMAHMDTTTMTSNKSRQWQRAETFSYLLFLIFTSGAYHCLLFFQDNQCCIFLTRTMLPCTIFFSLLCQIVEEAKTGRVIFFSSTYVAKYAGCE